ncbi:MAG: ABATE domain-containing protein [Chloroflexi bacterium]|nr:ABATE domain-containing protein [Chloroflexota bacterium]
MTVDDIKFCGGRLCLDFANTAGDHSAEHPSEYLATYGDLVVWSERAGILGIKVASKLLDKARSHPAIATRVLSRAIGLREAIFRIFSAASRGNRPDQADLDRLNGWLKAASEHSSVGLAEHGYAWQWDAGEQLDRMLWEVARSAADLLTSIDLNRVSQCGNADCGWLFVDTSKNHSRRWCDMSDCGNRVKARRYYGRQRAARLRRTGASGDAPQN